MQWIKHPLILEGKKIRLVPLEDKYFQSLVAAGTAKEIWTHLPTDGSKRDLLLTDLRSALLKRLKGEQYSFVIIDRKWNTVIGGTRLFNIYPEHKKLEIGWTWIKPEYWGKGHNIESKMLLLEYCFETLKVQRVQLQTSEANLRSRAAIEKIGAKFEGILRNDRIRPTGVTNTAVYSIIDSEWKKVKEMLEGKLKEQKYSA
jgi:RimJ/RimL family protein N-acetyltransferase